MIVRAEDETDLGAVRAIHLAAFDTPYEANLVDTLRSEAEPLLSLVAEEDGEVVGHIMLSPVSLVGHDDLNLLGLAPMAVAPAYQRKGIGTALVRASLEQARQLGCAAVVVLGHPQYYPRFGFSRASRFHIECEFDVPDEAFMAIELQPGALSGRTGKIKYHSALS